MQSIISRANTRLLFNAPIAVDYKLVFCGMTLAGGDHRDPHVRVAPSSLKSLKLKSAHTFIDLLKGYNVGAHSLNAS